MAEPTTDTAVLARLVALRGRDVVDVGCGSGGLVRWLQGEGAHALGLEVTEAKVRAARRAGDGGDARFALGRGEAPGLPDDSQDLVIYMRSLHHVPVEAMDRALAEARRVLRDGGVLYVVEPIPEGAFFAMVELVDDETEVRAAAQAALARSGDHGFAHAESLRYDTESLYGGLEDVRDRIVGVDPARAPVFDARRPALAEIFRTGGELRADGTRRFLAPHRADVLRASSPGIPDRVDG